MAAARTFFLRKGRLPKRVRFSFYAEDQGALDRAEAARFVADLRTPAAEDFSHVEKHATTKRDDEEVSGLADLVIAIAAFANERLQPPGWANRSESPLRSVGAVRHVWIGLVLGAIGMWALWANPVVAITVGALVPTAAAIGVILARRSGDGAQGPARARYVVSVDPSSLLVRLGKEVVERIPLARVRDVRARRQRLEVSTTDGAAVLLPFRLRTVDDAEELGRDLAAVLAEARALSAGPYRGR